MAADSLPQTGHRVLQGPPVYDAVSGTSEDVLIVQLTKDSPADDTAEMTLAAVSGGLLTAALAMKLAWKGHASGPEIPKTAAKIVLDVLLNVMDVKTVWKCHLPGAEAAGFQRRTVEMDHVEAKKTSWLTILGDLTRAAEASVVPWQFPQPGKCCQVSADSIQVAPGQTAEAGHVADEIVDKEERTAATGHTAGRESHSHSHPACKFLPMLAVTAERSQTESFVPAAALWTAVEMIADAVAQSAVLEVLVREDADEALCVNADYQVVLLFVFRVGLVQKSHQNVFVVCNETETGSEQNVHQWAVLWACSDSAVLRGVGKGNQESTHQVITFDSQQAAVLLRGSDDLTDNRAPQTATLHFHSRHASPAVWMAVGKTRGQKIH